MNIDVGFWLSLALLICVLVWFVDKLFKIRKQDTHWLKSSFDFVISLLPVFFAVLVIRSFIVEPFSIPSGSMIPTLKVHDYIAVNKFAYGLRLPVTGYEFLKTGEPKRGDVMVFRYPRNTDIHFIKRVVGVPGDTVSMRAGRLWLNGKEVPHKPIKHWVKNGYYHLLEVENLSGHKHLIQRRAPINPYTGKPEWHPRDGTWTVPAGHYFMMGDNRDNSDDSRFWGTVPEKLITGQAFFIWMHLDSDFPWVDFSRDGSLDKAEYLQ